MGISFIRSEISLRQITDGTSKTYMAGEKLVNVDAYEFNDQTTVRDDGDDQGYLIGHNGDTVRSSGCPIMQDFRQTIAQHTTELLYNNWGSAHSGGINMMFADGSVRTVSYDVNKDVHAAMGTRAGGEIVSEN